MKRTPIFGKVGSAASATHAAAGSSRSLAKLGPKSVAVAAVLSLSVLAAGCGSDDAEGSGDGSSTLTVQVQSEQLDAFQYAADIFEDENPEVKVELQTITGEQKNSTNAQVMASSDAPDIGLVPTNAAPYLELMKNDALVPLDDVWESADLDNRMDEATAESLKSDGTPYVVLFDTVYYNVVFYNKQAFEKAGVEAPANHQLESPEQLYDIVDQLDEGGYKGLALGGSSGFQLGWMLDAQLAENDDEAAFSDFTNSWKAGEEQQVPYTDPGFLDSVAQVQEFDENGAFVPGYLGQDLDQAQAVFMAGEAAMLLGGNWMPAIFDDPDSGVKFDYDWLLLPATEGPTLPTVYAGDTLAIPTTSDNQEMAKKFLEVYVSDDVQRYAASKVGSMPAVTSVDPTEIDELPTATQDIVAFVNENGAGVGWTSVAPGALAQTFIDPQMQQMLAGQTSLEELGEAQQEQFESFKKDNG
jgi:raffinose/stachyose/melibiose transport system substrate-binding protein